MRINPNEELERHSGLNPQANPLQPTEPVAPVTPVAQQTEPVVPDEIVRRKGPAGAGTPSQKEAPQSDGLIAEKATSVNEAREKGISDMEIKGHLIKIYGETEAASIIGAAGENPKKDFINKTVGSVKKALVKGIPEDQIKAHLTKLHGTSWAHTIMSEAKSNDSHYETGLGIYDASSLAHKPQTEDEDNLDEATKRAAAFNDSHSRILTWDNKSIGFFVDKDMISANQEIGHLNSELESELKEKGFDVYIDQDTRLLMLRGEKGADREVTPHILEEMWANKGVIGGMITGAYLASKKATTPRGKLLSGIVGGVGGLIAGSAVDYGINTKLTLKNDIEAKVMFTKMADEGIADALTLTFLSGAWHFGGKQVTSAFVNTLGHAFRMLVSGNVKAGKKIMRQDLGLSEAEVAKKSADWPKIMGTKEQPIHTNVFGVKRPLTDEEFEMYVIARTTPGAEDYINSSGVDKHTITNLVNDTTKEIRKTTSRFVDKSKKNFALSVKGDLAGYVATTKANFNKVKDFASKTIDRTDWRINVDKLGLEKIQKRLEGELVIKKEVDYFARSFAKMINKSATGSRKFSDLYTLRETANKLKDRMSEKVVQDGIKEVIRKIDKQLKSGAEEYLEGNQGKLWFNAFKKTKKEFWEMKEVSNKRLFKEIVDADGALPDKIIKALVDEYPSIDPKFAKLMSKLPKSTQDKVEGTIAHELTERYITGEAHEKAATDLVTLAKKLREYDFKNPIIKKYVDIVEEKASLLKNEVGLGVLSGTVKIHKTKSYLAGSLKTRAQFALISGITNMIQRLRPSDKSNRTSAAILLGKILDNPQDARAIKAFVNVFPHHIRKDAKNYIDTFAQTMDKEGTEALINKKSIRIYKATAQVDKNGKPISTNSSGGLGKGHYFVEQVASMKEARNVIAHEVPLSKLATLKDVSKVMGRKVDIQEIKSLKSLKRRLDKLGFEGIRDNGKVVLFDHGEAGAKAVRKPRDKAPVKTKSDNGANNKGTRPARKKRPAESPLSQLFGNPKPKVKETRKKSTSVALDEWIKAGKKTPKPKK